MTTRKASKGSRKSGPKTKKSPAASRPGTRSLTRLRTAGEKPGWMGIEGLHLTFTTKEPHIVANFYRDSLGFVDAGVQRPTAALNPGYARNDEIRGSLCLRTTRDTLIEFQDYNMAYHWVAQLGGRPPEEPLSSEIYLLVRDVDRVYERLSKKGVQFFSPPREMPWGHRIVECSDPEGRRLIFAEVLKKKK
jgi:uncharacterized glyoxalase superfamily protein PhnB